MEHLGTRDDTMTNWKRVKARIGSLTDLLRAITNERVVKCSACSGKKWKKSSFQTAKTDAAHFSESCSRARLRFFCHESRSLEYDCSRLSGLGPEQTIKQTWKKLKKSNYSGTSESDTWLKEEPMQKCGRRKWLSGDARPAWERAEEKSTFHYFTVEGLWARDKSSRCEAKARIFVEMSPGTSAKKTIPRPSQRGEYLGLDLSPLSRVIERKMQVVSEDDVSGE